MRAAHKVQSALCVKKTYYHYFSLYYSQFTIRQSELFAMDDCILVKGITSELAEVELEEDGTVSLEALRCHFGPLVVSMKYTNETTGLDRFVRVFDGHFLPPKDGWGSRTYKTISREERDGNNRPRAPDSLYQHPLMKLEPNLPGGAEVESESRLTQDLEVKAGT